MPRPPRLLAAVFIGWTGLAVAGFAALASYETAPGASGAPAASWPAAATLPAPTERPALVVAAHPRCPCTRATVAELARLVRHVEGRADVYALFVQPDGTDDAFAEADLWRAAAAIPGVRVVRDMGGHEARRFGALTSGHALLYDVGGALRYSGGLTASRGHEGANAGRTALQDLLTDGAARHDRTPVFGCPLQDSSPPLGAPAPRLSRSTS